jgi:hypothetical protein
VARTLALDGRTRCGIGHNSREVAVSRSIGRRHTDSAIVAPIEAGRVVCPVRGGAELEDCWNCPAYLGMSDDRIQGVVCDPERRRLLSGTERFGPH